MKARTDSVGKLPGAVQWQQVAARCLSVAQNPVRRKKGKGTPGFAQLCDKQAEENMQDEAGEVG